MKPITWIMLSILILILILILSGFVFFKVYNQVFNTNQELKGNLSYTNLYNIYNVDITRKSFLPPTIEIQKGDMIMWKNQDTTPHRIVSKKGYKFDSKNLAKGQNFTLIFNNVTEIEYYDLYFPYIRGKIIIKDKNEISNIGKTNNFFFR